MNLLAEILTSRTRAEIFRIFFGLSSCEMHLREIERQSGITINAVRKEAENLARLSFLVKRIDGNRTYYRANSSHYLYKTLRELILKTVGAGEILKVAFSGEKVKFVFIFGSVASGNERPESDIDLFVIGETGLRAVSRFLKEPALKIGREINPQVMSQEEFVKRLKSKDHFVCSVLESTIQMIIGNECELRNLG